MAIKQIIVLSVLFSQTLSAPSACIESCNFHQSYQSHRVSSGHQDHANLVQDSTNLNNYDYTRPGNWTERNQYNTNGGHGKVHEERGQYVEGSKRVQYYKKNFTSSYGTGNVNGTADLSSQHRYDSLHIPSDQHLESSISRQAVTQESGYNRVHGQQSTTRIDGKSERLEDFGEYGGHSQHGVNVQTSETTPDNWRRVDSYKTDDGHGRVFEEEGQHVTGPTKVRYYKKNYTSSYSTSGDVGSAALDKLHGELQKNVQEELDKFRRDFHHQTASATGLTQETVHNFRNDLQTAESENTYGQQRLSGYRRVPSLGTVHHYTDQQHTETLVDTGSQRSIPLYPITNTYGTENQRTYQSHETHVSRAHPVPQSSHLSSSYPVQVTGDNYQSASYSHSGGRQVDDVQRAEVSGAHRSNVAQNRLLTERVYPNTNPNYSAYPSSGGRRDETRYYQEEHWQSSSNRNRGNPAPERNADLTISSGIGGRTHYDRDAYNEQRGRYHSAAHGYDSRVGSSYSSGYSSGASSGQQLVAAGSSLDHGRATHGADCTEETHQQYQHESSYHRKYKRDDHRVRQDQELEADSKQLDMTHASNQRSEDFTQHDEDFTQHDEDFTQQTEGQLEFGQQTVNDQHLNDFTQQSEQFTHQMQGFNHVIQGTNDKLNFGPQAINNQHSEDLTQQNEQFTQETEGQFEFGQQTSDNQYLKDLRQQSEKAEFDDYTQQTEGKLEFGQQIDDTQQLTQQIFNGTDQHLAQHNEQFMQQEYDDLAQQTSGKLEFGQQTVDDQHLEDLKQQTEQFEKTRSDDYTQQTVGKLEFGQQTDDTQQLTQQTENFAQHATKSENLTQEINDKLEFGIGKPTDSKNQHLEEFDNEEFSQHTGGHDDFTQQTMGQLEFGQQTFNDPKIDHHSNDFTQQSEDLTQQDGEFDDFMQQDRLEYGQQRDDSQKPSWPRYNTQHLEHISQQDNWNIEDLSQQSHQYPSYDNKNNEQSELQLDMSQQTEQDFTQQTNDGRQLPITPAPKPKPRQRPQRHDSIPHMDGTDTNLDEIFKPIEVNPEADIDNLQEKDVQHSSRLTHSRSDRRPGTLYTQNQGSSVFDNEKENIDRLHWVHKSNDATVGLQWHYTYHPSDLTNIVSSHNSYYPHHNVNSMSQQKEVEQQQQSRPFDQLETQDRNGAFIDVPQISQTQRDSHHNVNSMSQQTEIEQQQQQSRPFDQLETQDRNGAFIDVPQISQTQRDEHDQQLESLRQTETSRFDNQFNQDSEQTPFKVIPLQNSQQTSMQATERTEDKIESRILEAYGGGPYDASRNDDIYRRVRPNPSATLPPIGGEDPWDIREKPRETIPWTVINTLPAAGTPNLRAATTTEATEITTRLIQNTTEAPPSFWNRLGHKITTTYDKAKEKAKEIFG